MRKHLLLLDSKVFRVKTHSGKSCATLWRTQVGVSLSSHVNHNINSGTPETKCIALGCPSPDWSCHSNFPALLLLSLEHKPDKKPDTALENTNRPYFLLLSKVLPWLCISLRRESKILRVAHKSCHLSDLAGLVPSYSLLPYRLHLHQVHSYSFALAVALQIPTQIAL